MKRRIAKNKAGVNAESTGAILTEALFFGMDDCSFKERPAVTIPDFPKDLTLWNPASGRVPITHHAWERFVEYCRFTMLGNLSWERPQEYFVEKMMTTFLKAKEVKIDLHKAAEKILKHNGDDARFFEYGDRQLCFVVVRANSVLVTVTAPRYLANRRP